jgi:hypothetical protein
MEFKPGFGIVFIPCKFVFSVLQVIENPDFAVDEYVLRCGFGSVNSMKRSVAAITGISFSDFKSSLLIKKTA